MKDLWNEVPPLFKVLWVFGILSGISITGLTIALLWKLIGKLS